MNEESKYPPGVIVITHSDYEGYFEGWLRRVLWEKFQSMYALRHSTFYITAGSHRGYDVAWDEDDSETSILKLDFYSGTRRICGPELCDELFDAL